MARIELILRQSGAGQLDADLVIFDEHGNPSQIADSLTQIPETLSQSIEKWKGSFSSLVVAGRGIRAGKVSYESCADCAEQVRESFRGWLMAQESWQRLQECIGQYASSNEEVQINIRTVDAKLRLLPWNEIFQQNHRYAETSISLAREFERRATIQPKRQVRILAVLGSSGEASEEESDTINPSIDVDFDYQQLDQTKGRGAYIQTFTQPTAEELRNALRDPEGWHIFFFAGHSKSLQDNTIGSIVLNQTETPLSIDTLKAELSVAIENGLYIAIFNSCDGLGLANQLAALNLPQSIVMREPVPDAVAQDFLQQFLKEFSYNQSLFESVRRARDYIRQEWDNHNRYPGASWLPTIVRNPAAALPKWNDFIADSPVSWKVLLPITALVLASLGSLFLSLYSEFGTIQISSRPKYIYYAQLYPHLILYPWVFLWGAYFTLYKAWCQIRSKPKLWRQVAGAIGIAVVLLSVELTSDNMLLFELKEGAESVVTVEPSRLETILNTPVQLVDIAGLIREETGEIIIRKADMEAALESFRMMQATNTSLKAVERAGYHEFMKIGLSYATWKGKGYFSNSRKFYALSFLNIIFVVIVSGIFWGEIHSNRHVHDNKKYIKYIIATQIIVLLWVPIRIYHNLSTKNYIFGNEATVTGLDVIVYPVILVLLAISIYKSWGFGSSYLPGIISVICVLGFLVIAITNSNLIGFAFGLDSNPSTWVLWPILGLIIIYLIYSDIFQKDKVK